MTLTEASALTKKALVFGAIFLTVVIFAWVSFAFYYYQVYLPNRRPVEEQPTLEFGKLPKISLDNQTVDSSNLNYKLDTKTGTLDLEAETPYGTRPKLFRVYSVAQLATDLLALDKAKTLAGNLGYKAKQQAISPVEYKFVSESGGELTIRLDTGHFNMRRPESTESAEIENRQNFLNADRMAGDFKNYLSSKRLLNEGLENGRTKVFYDRSMSEVTKLTVYLWQNDVDKIPLVSDKLNEALIKGVMTNRLNEDKKYILIDYTYWPIDLNNFETYPLITVEEAFKELETGNALVSFYSKGTQVSLTRVYLAYYLPLDYTPYLQPVYVFEGPEFAAYVQAIKGEHLEEKSE